jgi:hypothetical protein
MALCLFSTADMLFNRARVNQEDPLLFKIKTLSSVNFINDQILFNADLMSDSLLNSYCLALLPIDLSTKGPMHSIWVSPINSKRCSTACWDCAVLCAETHWRRTNSLAKSRWTSSMGVTSSHEVSCQSDNYRILSKYTNYATLKIPRLAIYLGIYR